MSQTQPLLHLHVGLLRFYMPDFVFSSNLDGEGFNYNRKKDISDGTFLGLKTVKFSFIYITIFTNIDI